MLRMFIGFGDGRILIELQEEGVAQFTVLEMVNVGWMVMCSVEFKADSTRFGVDSRVCSFPSVTCIRD
jgi:hypothetical protein